MSEYVYVVTHLELGWDCVCGVYTSYEGALRYVFPNPEHEEMSAEELEDLYNDDNRSCIIHQERLES